MTILEQGKKRAGELAAKVEGDQGHVTGEVSVRSTGETWSAKAYAKLVAVKDKATGWLFGGEVTKRW